MAVCEVASCSGPVFARHWCQKHYARWLKYRDPLFTRTPGRESGRRTRGGPYIYVKHPECPISDATGWVAEHRYVVWLAGFRITPEDHVHHKNGIKTDNRLSNLEVVNGRIHIGRHKVRKGNQCKHGHEMTAENTYIRPNGRDTECRICLRRYAMTQREKLRG